ncbi:MAG TPA: hypothetical protein VFZ09_37595 [Archangium sp.]|uniref:hypothetical protein n=1 Tax=Archangium sp. TaxID=1872627 RepID=UPI002E342033|nr:hypothetical protein [Archangium sp.]HEX5751995.1 hypothetical protein [Archangium sp.]
MSQETFAALRPADYGYNTASAARCIGVELAWWVCILALVLQACATTGAMDDLEPEEDLPAKEIGRALHPSWETRDAETDEEARRAEATAALSGMRGVASHVEEAGAELVFRFWAQDGVLTLLSWKRSAGEAGFTGKVDSFVRDFEVYLPTYVRARTGEVVFTLLQEQRGWSLRSVTTAEGSKPLEARTLPVRRSGVTADTLAQAHAVAIQLAKGLRVPNGGNATVLADVLLDDDRVLGATTARYESHGGPPVREPSPELAAQITQALLPFTHGIGPRTVRLTLQAEHHRAERHARWRVMEAETLRPESRSSPDLVAEHYALYERILREWREETQAAFLQAGVTSTEFLATWFISSLALRGGITLFEAVAPRLAPILARGGSEAVAWLRSFLARVRPTEREQFHRLWTKAQTQGLSAAEKEQLRKLMARFEKLLGTKLDRYESNELRRMAHDDFYEKLHPNLAKLLLDDRANLYPVHHRVPIEYAHLFVRLNINAKENLWGVHKSVHQKINNIWTAFRRAKGKATAEDVRKVAAIVDRHFGRWFNQRYEASRSASALAKAEADALDEVKVLVDLLMK